MQQQPVLLFSLSLLVLVGISFAQFTTTANTYSSANANGGFMVSNFDSRPASATPGNVGLCFSGGGSRALSAAMGQMRALDQLGLMSQVKAISSISGGSWATVPYTFLPTTISDSDFLGPYEPNPANLDVLTGNNPLNQASSPVNLGAAIINNDMSMASIAIQAISFYSDGVPESRLWTRAIGQNILGTFGLAAWNSNNEPENFFCANQAQCNAILAANPQFSGYNMMRPGRPFHIINTAMFVNAPNLAPGSFQYLAPFHATPYFAGVISTPPNANSIVTGNQVGGGAVQSYAFNSQYQSGSGSISVSQTAPFALSDIMGASSAAFAEVIENDVRSTISGLGGLDPSFGYFSAADMAAGASGGPTSFSDGGTLDNSGVCAMLQYQDIDNLIVFVNSAQALSTDSNGNVLLADMLAPLFGYYPYSSSSSSYVPYPATNVQSSDTSMNVEFRFNQVFESSQFSVLQQGLLAATQGSGSTISTAPCYFLQSGLTVQANEWYGIPGGKTVNVLWVYNQDASQFTSQLTWEVSAAMTGMSFPWYPTANTGLDAFHVNLLAHFSAWVVMQAQSTVLQMFTPSTYADLNENPLDQYSAHTIEIIAGLSASVVVVAVVAAVLIVRYKRRHYVDDETFDDMELDANV